MNTPEEKRRLVAEQRLDSEQLQQRMLTRAEEEQLQVPSVMDEEVSEAAREATARARLHEEHQRETMLHRAEEAIETPEQA